MQSHLLKQKINQNELSKKQIYKENIDNYYMSIALKEAKKAYDNGEIPIGAIIVYNINKKNKKMYNAVKDILSDKEQIILSKAYNKRNIDKNAINHAEILAISKACKKVKDFRLEDCTMYVNLEPCPMCAGAILQSRIKRLVIGTNSIKSGSVGSIINILDNKNFNHKVDIKYGVLEEESKILIKNFFKQIRK